MNPTYQDLAEHYGVAVIPTQSRKPKDKAKAEVGVQVAERWIPARLRNRTFFSLADLNQAIRELLNPLNQRTMKHLCRSRREFFELLDQPALRPLPEQPYQFATWKKARVSIDYHIEFKKHYYSVPHTLIHEEVYLRATESTVEIFFKNHRVASHPRSRSPGRHTTRSEHMPTAHQEYLEWAPERFVHWAQTIGPHTAQVVQAILDSRKHPQQAYRSCLGLLRLGNGWQTCPRIILKTPVVPGSVAPIKLGYPLCHRPFCVAAHSGSAVGTWSPTRKPHPQPRRRGCTSSFHVPSQQLLSFSKIDATMCLGADLSPQVDPQVSTSFLLIRGPKDGANLTVEPHYRERR